MATNTHTFEQGETFDGQQSDEEIVIRRVREHTVTWDYKVDGKTLGRSTEEKEVCRKFIQYGHWKPRHN
jgi:hypothetical protein